MTAPGQYAANDGSFARSAGGAAGRGLVLIVVAVIVGLVLLAKGFDGADPSLAEVGDSAGEPAGDGGADDGATDSTVPADGESSDTVPADGETTDTTPTDSADPGVEPTATHAPADVKVAVVNGVGEGGLAGAKADILDTQGFVTAAKNTAAPVDVSVVYYVEGYSEDAKVVASLLSLPADIIQLAAAADVLALVENNTNVADFHVFVIQGGDRVAG